MQKLTELVKRTNEVSTVHIDLSEEIRRFNQMKCSLPEIVVSHVSKRRTACRTSAAANDLDQKIIEPHETRRRKIDVLRNSHLTSSQKEILEKYTTPKRTVVRNSTMGSSTDESGTCDTPSVNFLSPTNKQASVSILSKDRKELRRINIQSFWRLCAVTAPLARYAQVTGLKKEYVRWIGLHFLCR